MRKEKRERRVSDRDDQFPRFGSSRSRHLSNQGQKSQRALANGQSKIALAEYSRCAIDCQLLFSVSLVSISCCCYLYICI